MHLHSVSDVGPKWVLRVSVNYMLRPFCLLMLCTAHIATYNWKAKAPMFFCRMQTMLLSIHDICGVRCSYMAQHKWSVSTAVDCAALTMKSMNCMAVMKMFSNNPV